MRVAYVTSSVTYVPDNYGYLFDRLCDRNWLPAGVEPAALVLLQIPTGYILKNVAGLIAIGAPDVGFALWRNLLRSKTRDSRPERAQAAGMKIFRPKNVNHADALGFFRELNPDLIVNARTRNIYKSEILGLPKLGCINIHHGLLPEHRGTMCDLWAWAEGRPVGFTIHRMNEKIDDGKILVRREIPVDGLRSYVEIPGRSSRYEAEALRFCLERLAGQPDWAGYPNQRSELPHTRTPAPGQIAAWRRRGLGL